MAARRDSRLARAPRIPPPRNMNVRARDVAEAYEHWRTLVQEVNALRHGAPRAAAP